MNEHECIVKSECMKIDNCSGESVDRCYGTGPIILELHFMDKDGLESYCDNWTVREVNYCPFCGLSATLGSFS